MGEIIQFLVTFGLIILAVIVVAQTAIKILKEYERGVIFRLGRLHGVKGPGIFFIIPFVDRMVKVDLRVVTLDIPTQEAITRDNVTVKVNAVTFFRVVDPGKSIVAVEDFRRATWQISQTTLRSVLGQSDLDELLIHREEINQKLQKIIDEQTEPWGIKVSIVEVKDVELPDSLKRAMSAQAEAEREKRAKIINAEGELVAARQLTEAAQTMANEPMSLQLRYLQTLVTVSAEKNSTILFPVPIEFMSVLSALGQSRRRGGDGPAASED